MTEQSNPLEDLFPGPNPYKTRDRILRLRPAARRKLIRLAVWCENSKCSPVRVFQVREGLLVLCRSDASTKGAEVITPHGRPWARRRAFFVDEWFGLEGGPEYDRSVSHLQVVCDCRQTMPRLVDVQKLIDLIPPDSEPTRNVTLPEVAATIR